VAVASAAAAAAVAKAVEPQPQASLAEEKPSAEPQVVTRSSKKKKREPKVAVEPVPVVLQEASPEITTNPVKEFLFKSAPDEPLGGKWRILVAAAAVLIVLLGGIGLWRWHRNHNGINTVQATEKKPAETTPVAADPNSSQTVIDAANAAHPPNAGAQPNTQGKSQTPAAKPGTTAASANKQPAKPDNTTPPQQPPTVARLDNGPLRTPTAMPKAATVEDAAAPSGIPGAIPNGTAPNLGSLVNVPVAEPKLAAGKVKVSSGVAQGLLVHQVTPQYPLQARESGIHGTVVVEAVIGKDGSVRSVKAVKGNPLLVKPALDAVKQWRYKPYYLNGEPIDAETQISVNFNLPEQ
jgi:protein TonB